jgi:hypothetical protein
VDLPEWSTIDGLAALLAVAALLAMLRFKVSMGWTLLASGIIGATSFLAFGHVGR